MAFYERLKEARINAGFTQEQLAEQLGIAKSTLSGYESGNREPTVATMAKSMDILKVDANFLYQDEMDALGGSPMQLKYDEMKHMEKYRNLNDAGKSVVDYILDHEYDVSISVKGQSAQISELESLLRQSSDNIRIYTYMRKIAAAGNGFYFDDIPTDTIEAPYMEGADFIIGVSGDSMEPDYSDGDLVYVQKRQIVETGEIGIFMVNGECYIKEAGEASLISHNAKYKPIPGSSDIQCVGKVLGKVSVD